MNRLFLPLIGAAVIIFTASVLIIPITLRPWGGVDKSYDTNLNIQVTPPEGYGRSILSFVPEKGDIEVWEPSYKAKEIPPEERGRALFVSYGCARCHGLMGEGGAFSPAIVREEGLIKYFVRYGSPRMPSYSEGDLPEEDLKLIIDWLIKGP